MPEESQNPGSTLPLDGIRVLDFGHFIAGPMCAALLGDLGADVIRIERTQGAADRFVTPLSDETPDLGALYATANRNKRSLALNLADKRSRPIVEKLIERSDVVVVNLAPQTLTKLKLDHESLRRLNPAIVSANCTAYGNRGPWRDRPGFDGTAQAMSGAMHMSGVDGEPRKSYVHFVDYFSAALGALGVVAELYRRPGLGGRPVETSLFGAAMAMMNSILSEEAVYARGRQGTGNRAQTAGPADVFETLDGKIILQVVGDSRFADLAKLIGEPGLVDDPRFRGDYLRGENSLQLSAHVAPWCASRTTEECVTALTAEGLSASPVLAPAEVLQHPQQAEHPSRFDVHYPRADATIPVYLPLEHVARQPRPSPGLGEHNGQILAEIGYSDTDIDAFIASGVINTRGSA